MINRLSFSIMCADQMHLADAIKEIESAEADLIHADVMDGNFVPNMTLGIDQLTAIAKQTSLPVEAHLMVCNLKDVLPAVCRTGCTHISFHIEVTDRPVYYLQMIRQAGIRAGLAFNPHTEPDCLRTLGPYVDYVLLMTVEPGFAGQRFIDSCTGKIRRTRVLLGEQKDLFVDGNMSPENAKRCREMGANSFVIGTAGAYTNEHIQEERVSLLRQNIGQGDMA